MRGVTGKLNRDQRAKEIAKIKVGVKRLGLDDAAYRAMLFTLTGRRSAADLDAAGRRRVIDSLKKDGAYDDRDRRPVDPFAQAWAEIAARLADYRRSPLPSHVTYEGAVADTYDDHQALYLSAWYWLGEHGHLWSEFWREAGETTFVMRTAHVAHLRFCTPAMTNKLVEAVKVMVKRAVAKASKGEGR